MNLIAFSRSRNCVITQYAALPGALDLYENEIHAAHFLQPAQPIYEQGIGNSVNSHAVNAQIWYLN